MDSGAEPDTSTIYGGEQIRHALKGTVFTRNGLRYKTENINANDNLIACNDNDLLVAKAA